MFWRQSETSPSGAPCCLGFLNLFLSAFQSDLLCLVQAHLQVLQGLLHVLFHSLQVCTRLLLHSQCFVPTFGLTLQAGLHCIYGSLVVFPVKGCQDSFGLCHTRIDRIELPSPTLNWPTSLSVNLVFVYRQSKAFS
uniref:Uncharacterized protein n=1 Tax=Eptatretus burgeri TaxID=7764 RepID=A0A8C4Q3K3_EPTBU